MPQTLMERGKPADCSPWACRVIGVLLAVTTLVIFAHGCHGPDEDHEPAAVPTRFTEPAAPASE